MSEEERFYSVKEFAELVGISTQAIYKRLATDLQPFCNQVGNRKKVSEQALKLFDVQPVGNPVANLLQPEPTVLERTLQETLETLKAQLAEKDQQLATKDGQIKELNARLAEAQSMAQANAVLASQAQQLQAIETQERQERRRRWFRRG